jgi:hypothetical protein
VVGETTTAEQPTPPKDEDPKLEFRTYAVAFHLAATWFGEGKPPSAEKRRERAMESYEDDMLLYAHRDAAPFRTRVAEPIRQVSLGFAPEVTYEAEGKRQPVLCAGASEAGRFRRFSVLLGETPFKRSETIMERKRCPLGVLTLVLTPPDPRAEGSELNEYDVIKLVKLWEGGESVEALSAIIEKRDLWFTREAGEQATLHDLAIDAFPGWKPLDYSEQGNETGARQGYRVGTLELELPRSNGWNQELFEDIAKLKRSREAPEDSERRDRVVAVGGILQGLLGFREIEDYELADVFADIDVDPEDETLRAFHKGTLLSLSGEAEAEDEEKEERPPPLGIDPYLAVPNIVLLHNEQRLKSARRLESELSTKQRGPVRELLGRAAINATENGLNEMARLLDQDLPNVFHYKSERRLQKRGRESRGLDDLNTFMRLRMDDLSSVLQSRVRSRDRWTAVLGIAVGVVTAFLVQQAIEGRPLWLIVVAAGALFAVFLVLRDKLF